MFNGGTSIWMFMLSGHSILVNVGMFVYRMMGGGLFPPV